MKSGLVKENKVYIEVSISEIKEWLSTIIGGILLGAGIILVLIYNLNTEYTLLIFVMFFSAIFISTSYYLNIINNIERIAEEEEEDKDES